MGTPRSHPLPPRQSLAIRCAKSPQLTPAALPQHRPYRTVNAMRNLIVSLALVGAAGSVNGQDAMPPNPDLPCGTSGPSAVLIRSRVESGSADADGAISGWSIYRRRAPATEWESPPLDQRGTAVAGATVEHLLQLDPTEVWEIAIAAYGPAGPSDLSNVLRIPASAKLCARPSAPQLVGFEWTVPAPLAANVAIDDSTPTPSLMPQP